MFYAPKTNGASKLEAEEGVRKAEKDIFRDFCFVRNGNLARRERHIKMVAFSGWSPLVSLNLVEKLRNVA